MATTTATKFKTKKAATEVAGTLGAPSKMPGKSYGIPAAECKTGSKLRRVAGSVCSKCYACSGHYRMSNVAKSQYRRYQAIQHPDWVQAMVKLIGDSEQWFRWHDSGDIQSVQHLAKIAMVAALTPHVRHWLPTKEKGMVSQYLRDGGTIPENLTIRISGAMINGEAPVVPEGCQTSTVHSSHKQPLSGYSCPAYTQDGRCGSCRACWDKTVANVSYPQH